ncbi:TPA: hypothetical protein ACH3X1_000154 [Trebouxia sp. C0004]
MRAGRCLGLTSLMSTSKASIAGRTRPQAGPCRCPFAAAAQMKGCEHAHIEVMISEVMASAWHMQKRYETVVKLRKSAEYLNIFRVLLAAWDFTCCLGLHFLRGTSP